MKTAQFSANKSLYLGNGDR